MPLREAMKSASFPRQRGCFDAHDTQARKTKVRSQRCQDRTTISSKGNTSNSNKLQELKLAFCLLSREIQGLDDGEKNVPATAETTPCSAATKKPPDFTQPGIVPPAATAERVFQHPHDAGEAKEPVNCLEGVNAVSRFEGRKNLRERSGTTPSRAQKTAAGTEGREAGEATAVEVKEALKHLRVELEREKVSRIAAER